MSKDADLAHEPPAGRPRQGVLSVSAPADRNRVQRPNERSRSPISWPSIGWDGL